MYTFSLVQWATMPWLEEAPPYLTQQWGSYGSMRKMSGREGDVGGLRGKDSQGIHEQHNSMQERCCLRGTSHPPFIALFWGFRVLSPWFRL